MNIRYVAESCLYVRFPGGQEGTRCFVMVRMPITGDVLGSSIFILKHICIYGNIVLFLARACLCWTNSYVHLTAKQIQVFYF